MEEIKNNDGNFENAAEFDDLNQINDTFKAAPVSDDLEPDMSFTGRLKRAIKTRGYLGLCFIIPALIMWLIYASMEAFPFGEESVLVLDLNGQYVYYFEALRDILTEGGSFLYTFRRALGGEFLGIIGYYLASPLSIIVALFPASMMTEALLCMFLIKTGLSGLTFAIYLDRTRKKNPVLTVMFSMMYALTAYAVVMQHNTMWIDSLIMLPLVLLGVESLIKHKKYKLFIISLSISVFSNFYIGYMTCIFVALYFFYYYYAHSEEERNPEGEKRHFLYSLIRIGLCAILMVCITAVMIWSSYNALTFGKTEFTNPSYGFGQNFDFLDLVSKMYFGSYDTVRPEGWPFVYSGMLTFMFVPLYFFLKKEPLRKKIATSILITVMFLCFNGSTLDIVWHGMQKPNWLNYRYSFMVCFLLLIMAHRVFEDIDDLGFKPVLFSACAISGTLMVLQKLEYENLPDLTAVWASLAFTAVYLLMIKGVTFPKAQIKRTSVIILTIFIGFEMYAAGLANLMALDDDVVYTKRTTYRNHMDLYTPAADALSQMDNSFYRSEKVVFKRTNDNLALGNFGLSNSTSTLNADTIKFLQYIGLASKSHWSKYQGSTTATDSLLGIKYLLGENKSTLPEYYTEVLYRRGKGTANLNKNIYAYRNPYAMSVVFGANEALTDIDLFSDDSEFKNPFERLNGIYAAALGIDSADMFVNLGQSFPTTSNLSSAGTTNHTKYTPIDSKKDSFISYTITAQTSDTIYMYIPTTYPRECELTVNGSKKGTYFGNETHRIVELGSYAPGKKLEIKLKLNKENLYIGNKDKLFFYYFDESVYLDLVQQLKGSEFNITEWNEDTLKGSINVQEGDELIFTTIPYDKGWKVTADGKSVETFEVLDSLIAFRLPAGEHTLEMKYRPACAMYGSIISLTGVVIFVAICVAERILKKKGIIGAPVPVPDNAVFDTADISVDPSIGEASSYSDSASDENAPDNTEDPE